MATVAKQPAAAHVRVGRARELLDDELRARFAPFGAVRSAMARASREARVAVPPPSVAGEVGPTPARRRQAGAARGSASVARGSAGAARGPSRLPAAASRTSSSIGREIRTEASPCTTDASGRAVSCASSAPPPMRDRLRMEREGAVLGLDGAEISAAEAAAAARALDATRTRVRPRGGFDSSTPRIRRWPRRFEGGDGSRSRTLAARCPTSPRSLGRNTSVRSPTRTTRVARAADGARACR